MTATDPHRFEALVLGSGVAGCSAALRLATSGLSSVAVLTKSSIGESTTRWAQGGIAAATSEAEDSIELHLKDTLEAGAGLCDEEATLVLVAEGPARVEDLISVGAVLDRDDKGELERAREGGHSVARVVHAGGLATGAEVARALGAALRGRELTLLEEWFALDLIVEDGRCRGVVARGRDGSTESFFADAVVLATGGSGQLFDVTTNPPDATGDGVAMALRAGVAVADVEFVQFHPTALAMRGHPRPLLSEALRGHGAVLLDASHERFVDELLPRDVVSQAIAGKIAEEQSEFVYLDCRSLEGFAERFPSLYAILADAGLDPSIDLLPVAPAAHYLCGGVLVDLDGATSLPGLWAVGEVACSGVQGANRLASNSLLEGLVFGDRAARAIAAGAIGPTATGALRNLVGDAVRSPIRLQLMFDEERPSDRLSSESEGAISDAEVDAMRIRLQQAMTKGAGVVRSAASLEALFDVLADAVICSAGRASKAKAELANLATLGRAVAESALYREESRGAHRRSDFSYRDDETFRCRIVHVETPTSAVREGIDTVGANPS